jgi:hypothetical protein
MMTDDQPNDGGTLHVDPAARHAVITWAPGVPVFNPWMTTIETLLSHPDFKPDFGVISDWRGAKGGPDQAFVDSFLVFCQSVRRARRLTGRWATVVAAAPDGEFGTGRTAEIQAGETGSETRVFKDLDEAIAWVSDRS